MIGQLPKSLAVCGVDYPIRSDFRPVLDIIAAYNDPDLEDSEKLYICLDVLYETYSAMPPEHYEEAFEAASSYMDCNKEQSKRRSPKTMDWEQDENLLFPAINKVAGFETRAIDYIHWWTFYGYFQEVGEGLFSTVVNVRQKKAKGKKLEKHEREFYAANKELCTIKPRLTQEEQEEQNYWDSVLGKK